MFKCGELRDCMCAQSAAPPTLTQKICAKKKILVERSDCNATSRPLQSCILAWGELDFFRGFKSQKNADFDVEKKIVSFSTIVPV